MSRLERDAWLLPAAFAAHVAEEAPGFTRWARRHASERYTQADFVGNIVVGLVLTAGATWAHLTRLALREGRLSRSEAMADTVAAGALHAAVLARQVFFVGAAGRASR